MQHTRDLKGVVQVDGDDYEWEVRRQPQRTTGNEWQGIGIALRLKDFKREAIVMFPMVMRANGMPNFERQRISIEAVKTAVGSAIAAGWDPTSRGKVVVFDVDAEGR
ncbi:MAG: hypothetical protein KKA16_12430 [Alphaproteobacteria bacterium]|nr:hypothetical protein [Alphaproteobacteria bacterium]MBU2377832.1 hypothetical protein [Alphaproteobacteria bacterium]